VCIWKWYLLIRGISCVYMELVSCVSGDQLCVYGNGMLCFGDCLRDVISATATHFIYTSSQQHQFKEKEKVSETSDTNST
jgi:hypothetical protein